MSYFLLVNGKKGGETIVGNWVVFRIFFSILPHSDGGRNISRLGWLECVVAIWRGRWNAVNKMLFVISTEIHQTNSVRLHCGNNNKLRLTSISSVCIRISAVYHRGNHLVCISDNCDVIARCMYILSLWPIHARSVNVAAARHCRGRSYFIDCYSSLGPIPNAYRYSNITRNAYKHRHMCVVWKWFTFILTKLSIIHSEAVSATVRCGRQYQLPHKPPAWWWKKIEMIIETTSFVWVGCACR